MYIHTYICMYQYGFPRHHISNIAYLNLEVNPIRTTRTHTFPRPHISNIVCLKGNTQLA